MDEIDWMVLIGGLLVMAALAFPLVLKLLS